MTSLLAQGVPDTAFQHQKHISNFLHKRIPISKQMLLEVHLYVRDGGSTMYLEERPDHHWYRDSPKP
jgi:hypothetical protein